MPEEQGICAIYMLDGCCSINPEMVGVLEELKLFDKALHYMNENRNNAVLRQVTKSLLQKGANLKDIESLVFELEK